MVVVDESEVEFLSSPAEFYDTLVRLASEATERVNIATLYIGNTDLELNLLRYLADKPTNILIDGLRGNRKESSGLSSIEMIKTHCPSARVVEFTSPLFKGLYARLPDRIREIVGTQHMKLFVADDTVVITGANLSRIYFTNRQDRYVVIRNKAFADSVSDVFLSQRTAMEDEMTPNSPATVHIGHSVQRGFDFPHTGQTDSVTESLLADQIDQDVKVTLSSPYLNLSTGILANIQKLNNVEIITNSIETNAFFGSKGPSRFIPAAYSILQDDLLQAIRSRNVSVVEYTRPGWSFHAKGVWVSRPSGEVFETIIGSSNFGFRSQFRDLEVSFRMRSESRRIQTQMTLERDGILSYCKPAIQAVRRQPMWLKYLTRGPLRTFL